MRRTTRSSTNGGSSKHRTPWSMRETRNSASASPMYDGAPSSPAVRLRGEEDLGVANVVGGRPSQIGHGHIVEVTLPVQDGGPLVVNVEEGLQIGELIGPPQHIDRTVAKGHPVAPRDLKHQLG